LPTPQKKAYPNYVTNQAISMHETFNIEAAGRALTPKSDAVGRCSMNSGKVLSFDIKMTYGKKLRCQRSAGFFC
jgi:hypothetical protein